jgi:general secretion pathway protein G
MRTLDKKSGFTLIEMLVVIAIIALLVSILVPTIGSTLRSAKTKACASNLRQIGTGFLLYANENEGKLPYQQKNSGTTWHIEIAPFLEDYSNGDYYNLSQQNSEPPGVYNCPLTDNKIRPGNYADYGMNYLINDHGTNGNQTVPQRSVFSVPTPTQTMLLADSVNCGRRLSPYSANGSMDPRHPGDSMNILFIDGHVDNRTIAEMHTDIQGNKLTQPPWGWEGWVY